MEDFYKANTSNIIALCHIVDHFEEFEKRVIPMLESEGENRFLLPLSDVSKGKLQFGHRRVKKFYQDNREVIDTINKYSDIVSFIGNKNSGGLLSGNLSFFNDYITSHRKDMDQILTILERVKGLGFSEIKFSEEFDFSKETYTVYPLFVENFHITSVANVEVIPSYTNYISYHTMDSNYKMCFDVSSGKILCYPREIFLNSLLFDPDSLPKKVDRKNIFDPILDLKNHQQETSRMLKNSVDLGVSILDLEDQVKSTGDIIRRLDNVESKKELLFVLGDINKGMDKLKALSTQYNVSIFMQDPLLTDSVLQEEKRKYLSRRDMSSIDSCQKALYVNHL